MSKRDQITKEYGFSKSFIYQIMDDDELWSFFRDLYTYVDKIQKQDYATESDFRQKVTTIYDEIYKRIYDLRWEHRIFVHEKPLEIYDDYQMNWIFGEFDFDYIKLNDDDLACLKKFLDENKNSNVLIKVDYPPEKRYLELTSNNKKLLASKEKLMLKRKTIEGDVLYPNSTNDSSRKLRKKKSKLNEFTKTLEQIEIIEKELEELKYKKDLFNRFDYQALSGIYNFYNYYKEHKQELDELKEEYEISTNKLENLSKTQNERALNTMLEEQEIKEEDLNIIIARFLRCCLTEEEDYSNAWFGVSDDYYERLLRIVKWFLENVRDNILTDIVDENLQVKIQQKKIK